MDDSDSPEGVATLNTAAFDRVQAALATAGPTAAADCLIDELTTAGDLSNLFYAKLLRTRVELGVSPFPTGPSADLPAHTHEPYEHAIREAARSVGTAFLERHDFGKAWTFFRMIGEPQPVRDALQAYVPEPDADVYPIIEVAWQSGVLPQKGFDLVLTRHGVCSAITMVSGSDLNTNVELRDYCVGQLVRALHAQLLERLRSDLETRGTPAPAAATFRELIAHHPELFADDAYHIDTSHLSSVVQMSTQLAAGEELELARELCEYGQRLAPGLQGSNDSPFDENYTDYAAFLDVVAGRNPDANLARFRVKVDRDTAEGMSYSAQVYVNLLLRANRPAEALAAAQRYLIAEEERNLICPGVTELARRVGDYAAVAEAARARNDAVGFLAGLIAGSRR